MEPLLVSVIAVATVAAILLRPWNLQEAVWACFGALLFVAAGALSPSQALAAVAKGADVYLFLTGMMLLAELARREGVFDWLAGLAVSAAKNSATRLFTLIFIVGTLVTVFLSNDATAVVLTPAVYAAVRKAKAQALPYLLICAFIANAASFVLPISNPANLVVYGKALPPLLPWIGTFLLPSLFSVLATYAALRWLSRKSLREKIESAGEPAALTKEGRWAACGIGLTGVVLVAVSAAGRDLGLPTVISASLAVLITSRARLPVLSEITRGVSWSVLPLVAGLFVMVEALSKAGATKGAALLLQQCSELPKIPGALAASFGIAAVSNLMNNLPSGLLSGEALQLGHVPAHIRNAVLIGVDLGPNLSINGSLATVLWLIAIRREGEQISAWQFLKAGAIVMPPALLLAIIAAVL